MSYLKSVLIFIVFGMGSSVLSAGHLTDSLSGNPSTKEARLKQAEQQEKDGVVFHLTIPGGGLLGLIPARTIRVLDERLVNKQKELNGFLGAFGVQPLSEIEGRFFHYFDAVEMMSTGCLVGGLNLLRKATGQLATPREVEESFLNFGSYLFNEEEVSTSEERSAVLREFLEGHFGKTTQLNSTPYVQYNAANTLYFWGRHEQKDVFWPMRGGCNACLSIQGACAYHTHFKPVEINAGTDRAYTLLDANSFWMKDENRYGTHFWGAHPIYRVYHHVKKAVEHTLNVPFSGKQKHYMVTLDTGAYAKTHCSEGDANLKSLEREGHLVKHLHVGPGVDPEDPRTTSLVMLSFFKGQDFALKSNVLTSCKLPALDGKGEIDASIDRVADLYVETEADGTFKDPLLEELYQMLEARLVWKAEKALNASPAAQALLQ